MAKFLRLTSVVRLGSGWLPLTLLVFAGRGSALAGDMWLAAASRGLARGPLCEAEHAVIRVSSDLRPAHTETNRPPGRPLGTADAAGFIGVFSFRGRQSI